MSVFQKKIKTKKYKLVLRCGKKPLVDVELMIVLIVQSEYANNGSKLSWTTQPMIKHYHKRQYSKLKCMVITQ